MCTSRLQLEQEGEEEIVKKFTALVHYLARNRPRITNELFLEKIETRAREQLFFFFFFSLSLKIERRRKIKDKKGKRQDDYTKNEEKGRDKCS